MPTEASSSRDSYYSSLFDEYMAASPRESTWSHSTMNSVKKRPSLNLHLRDVSISSLKRQPSFDCPTPALSSFKNTPNYSNPINSVFHYTVNGAFSPPPHPSPYVFTHYGSYNNGTKNINGNINGSIEERTHYSSYNNIGTKNINGGGIEERANGLNVPKEYLRENSRSRTPSLSGSSINEDRNNVSSNNNHAKHSSASSDENVPIGTPPKHSIPLQNSSNLHPDSVKVQRDPFENDRDRYGFKRSYQWISNKEYVDFEASYSHVLQRRKIKWETVLNENGGMIPNKCSKMKRYVRKGIPPSLRGRVWFFYSGAEAKMKSHLDLYQQLVLKAQDPRLENEYFEVIERDLHRTFPENIKFKSTVITDDSNSPVLSTDNVPIIQSLRRVLTAFSLYSPNIGYCQSLNYVAGILLLFMDEEKAFWMLVTIIHDYLPENMYDVTMEGSNVDQAVLMSLIMRKMPDIWNKMNGGANCDIEKLDGNMPTITLVTSHWFLTLYINILPIETLLRVWDCFFYEGNKILFRVALAILRLNEEKILAVDDPMEVFQVVQNMPKKLIDCHKLIDVCFRRRDCISEISQKDIDRRRELFRERRKKRVGTMLSKH
ncbi:5802_t:CDS:2 [Cetraspora pellucida]|uniref:5802_t:CDS:1 n=1 Tax=Cetraspora pellucida TaxID=1433469 RepID=A0A9N8ZFY3_9GLOM|nr:5802_t:CDS:2 [Cetraspora pellucida]